MGRKNFLNAVLAVGVVCGTVKAGPAGLKVEAADGVGLEFGFVAQLRWDYGAGWAGETSSTVNKPVLRRLRQIIDLSLEDGLLRMHTQLNLTPGALELLDYWLDWKALDWLQLRLGQAKIPFTRHRMNSFAVQTVVDWSAPTKYFGAERQLGVTVSNGMGRPARFEYELGLYSGVNARASNGIGPALVYKTELRSPSALVDPSSDVIDQLHSEVVLHLAYNSEGMNPKLPYDDSGGGFRYSAGFSVAWDLDPRAGRDLTLRAAPELQLRWAGLGVDLVGYVGWFDRGDGGGTKIGLLGALAEASCSPGTAWRTAVRYSMVASTGTMREDALLTASSGGMVLDTVFESVQEVVAAINWWPFGRLVALQLDAGWKRTETSSSSTDEVLMRAQIGFIL